MRLLLWIVMAVGGPFYAWGALWRADWGTVAIGLGMCALGVAALVADVRRAQARQGQQDFWRSQRRR